MHASPYVDIAEKIDKAALRVPRSKSGDGISEAFLEYLQLLYTPEEAEIASHLKIAEDIAWVTFQPSLLMTPIQIARVSGKPLKEVTRILGQMSKKSYVLDISKALKASTLNWPVKLVEHSGRSSRRRGSKRPSGWRRTSSGTFWPMRANTGSGRVLSSSPLSCTPFLRFPT